MEQTKLLSSAVELCLDLIEKNGTFLPLCKAVDNVGGTFIYASDSETHADKIEESVRNSAMKEIGVRRLVALAFCTNKCVHYQDSSDDFPTIKVEVHCANADTEIYYFPYKFEGGKATVLEYHKQKSNENWFAVS